MSYEDLQVYESVSFTTVRVKDGHVFGEVLQLGNAKGESDSHWRCLRPGSVYSGNMAILTNSIALDVGVLFLGLFGCLLLYITRNFGYWKKKGIPYIKPTPFVGNLKRIIFGQNCMGEQLANLYREAEGEPFVGIFAFDRPMLLVRDISLIKNILVKDFSSFADRSFNPDPVLDPLAAKNLFGLAGPKWRHLRVKLTPTFTSGRMKMMFNLVNECGKELAQYIEDKTDKTGEIEIKDAMARYTIDVIGNCVFGIQCNSIKNQDSEFRRQMKILLDFTIWKSIKMTAAFFAPAIVSLLKWRVFEVEITEFLRKTIWGTVEYREKNNVSRKDFLDLLIQIKNKGRIDDPDDQTNGHLSPAAKGDATNVPVKFTLEGDDFVAQAFVFLAAGFETSSTTMTFCLYELSLQPDIQKRLRDEIESVLADHKGEVTYEAIKEMEYLDMVVSETLRMYPVLPFLDRQVLQNYNIPGSDAVLDKGSGLMIPIMGIQRDPQFYPNPDHFDPERFTTENKKLHKEYTYLPFGEGPRICIGSRMGLMQVKVGLVHILSKFEVAPTKATPIPMVIDPKSFLLACLGGLPLSLKKIS